MRRLSGRVVVAGIYLLFIVSVVSAQDHAPVATLPSNTDSPRSVSPIIRAPQQPITRQREPEPEVNQESPESDSGLAAATPASERPTTIRVSGKLNVTWYGSPKSAYTTAMSAEVHNVGTVEAKAVHAVVHLVEGENIELKGPATIAPNKKAQYVYSGAQVNTRQPDRAEVKLRCENCRR